MHGAKNARGCDCRMNRQTGICGCQARGKGGGHYRHRRQSTQLRVLTTHEAIIFRLLFLYLFLSPFGVVCAQCIYGVISSLLYFIFDFKGCKLGVIFRGVTEIQY